MSVVISTSTSAGAEEKVGAAYAEVDALKEVVEEANAGKLPLQHLLGLTEDITADALLKKVRHRQCFQLA